MSGFHGVGRFDGDGDLVEDLALAVAVAYFERQAGLRVEPDFGGIFIRLPANLEMTYLPQALRCLDRKLRTDDDHVGREFSAVRDRERELRDVEAEHRQLMEQRRRYRRAGVDRARGCDELKLVGSHDGVPLFADAATAGDRKVKVGDQVKVGQLIGEASGPMAVPIHSSVSNVTS